jgi:hypothetical protein
MGRGGDSSFQLPRERAESDTMGWARVDSESTAIDPPVSIQLKYPKNRLLLGTMANMQDQNRGVHKALDTQYPLELSIECSNLPAARHRFLARRQAGELRPFAVIFFRNPRGGPWELIGRTETVLHDEYVRFVTKLKLSCATVADRLKEIRVVLYDRRTSSDDLRDQRLVGSAECRLDDIVSEPLLRKALPVRNLEKEHGSRGPPDLGEVILSADVIRPVATNTTVVFDVEVASISREDKRLFYVLSRQIRSGTYTAIYRSEVMGKNQKRFTSLSRALGAITAGVEGKLLRLDLYQFCPRGNHCKLGFMQTSISKLREGDVTARQLWWPGHTVAGMVDVGRVMLTARHMSDDKLAFRFRFTQ